MGVCVPGWGTCCARSVCVRLAMAVAGRVHTACRPGCMCMRGGLPKAGHRLPVCCAVACMQGVPMEDVMRVLRKRFQQSGVEEKASRPAKTQ